MNDSPPATPLYDLYHEGAQLFEEIKASENLPKSVRVLMMLVLTDVMYRVRPDSDDDKKLLKKLKQVEDVMGLICAVYKLPNFPLENRLHLLHCLVPHLSKAQ